MTNVELVKSIRAILPNADFQKDNSGQIIIYTGLGLEENKLITNAPYCEKCEEHHYQGYCANDE